MYLPRLARVPEDDDEEEDDIQITVITNRSEKRATRYLLYIVRRLFELY